MNKELLLATIKEDIAILEVDLVRSGRFMTPQEREAQHKEFIKNTAVLSDLRGLLSEVAKAPYDNVQDLAYTYQHVTNVRAPGRWNDAQDAKALYDFRELRTAAAFFCDVGVLWDERSLIKFRRQSWVERERMMKAIFPEKGDVEQGSGPCSCGVKTYVDHSSESVTCWYCLKWWSTSAVCSALEKGHQQVRDVEKLHEVNGFADF